MNVPARNFSEALLHLDILKDELAEAKAERDAARAEVESTWRCFQCGFCTTDYKQAEAHFGDRDEEMAICRWWKDSTDTERIQALQAAIEEQNAAQTEAARAVEALEKILVGGNHLASALTGMFGDHLPPYGTDFNEARNYFAGPDDYDLWVCWAVMMRVRDSLEVKGNKV